MKFKRSNTPGNIIVELKPSDSLTMLQSGSRKNTPTPFQLKNILVPIDFSDCSKKALVYALPYAKEFGAEITLLYVAQFHYAASEWDSAEAPVLENQHVERAKNELWKLAQQLPNRLRINTAVVLGKPFEEIVATAKALNADLIIIGTHGAMKQRYEYLGSTAERVVRYADCPVLIVRECEREFVDTNRKKKTQKNLSVERSAV